MMPFSKGLLLWSLKLPWVLFARPGSYYDSIYIIPIYNGSSKFKEESELLASRELLSDTALYLLDNGTVLQAGHTMELAGDGVIYKIEAVKNNPEAFFGPLGGLEVSRK